MHAEVLAVDDAGDGHGVEDVEYAFVDALRVLAAALGSEVVLLGHDPRLVVAAQQDYVAAVLDFQGHQDYHHFHRVYPSVDVVSQEDQFGFEGEVVLEGVAVGEDVEQVVELAVDVSDDDGGVFEEEEVGFVVWMGAGVRSMWRHLVMMLSRAGVWMMVS